MQKFLSHNRTHLITLTCVVFLFFSMFVLPNLVSANHSSNHLTGPAPTAANPLPPNGNTPATGGQNDTNTKNTDLDWKSKLVGFLGNFILFIGSYFTWFGGSLLNSSIEMFVLNITQYIGNGTAIGNSINTVWSLIRDICNLAFIFGFIYVGIRTIIDYENASTKRFLASIIIGALLINFSLFFAKVIIDVGNYIAVEIYSTLTVGTVGVNGNTAPNLSGRFADILGINSIYKFPDAKNYVDRGAGGNIAFFFMATIMLIVAGFVFAAGAVLLMIRFVALVLILCFSPILFAATVFPQTAGIAGDLWKKLISYSLFAPAYLLLLLVSIHLLDGVVTGIRGNAPLSGALNAEGTGATNGFGVVLSFGVAIFFMIMSLQIAQKFGVAGGDRAISMGNSLRGRGQKMLGSAAGGATFGLAGRLGRATAGRGANRISASKGLKDIASHGGVKGFAARQVLKTSRVAADATFDARKVGGIGGKLGIGEGAKGGYQTQLKEVKEKEAEFAKSLGEVGDDDVQVMGRKKEMQAEERKLLVAEEELQRERKRVLDLGAAAAPADKDSVIRKREIVEEQKKAIEEAKIKYESEKQRRVIGSTYAKPDALSEATAKAHTDEIKFIKDQIKGEWGGYAGLSEDMKKTRRDAVEKLTVELEKSKEAEYKFLTKNVKDRGYAGVLERSEFFTAWPVGRMVVQEKNAGEEIRKTAEKGLPKEKGD